jgi:hypothetical protein
MTRRKRAEMEDFFPKKQSTDDTARILKGQFSLIFFVIFWGNVSSYPSLPTD